MIDDDDFSCFFQSMHITQVYCPEYRTQRITPAYSLRRNWRRLRGAAFGFAFALPFAVALILAFGIAAALPRALATASGKMTVDGICSRRGNET